MIDGKKVPERGQWLLQTLRNTGEAVNYFSAKFQKIKMRKMSILVLSKLPMLSITILIGPQKHTEMRMKAAQFANCIHVHGFILSFIPHSEVSRTGMLLPPSHLSIIGTEAQQGNQHIRELKARRPTLLCRPGVFPHLPLHILPLSDAKACYHSFSNPQIQLCLIGMRIRIQEI